MNNKYEERLGTAPMASLIFKMAFPAMAAQLVNLFYNIIDRIYIGHIDQIGTDALAGVGITTAIIILVAAFSSIVGAGGAPLASIALGQDNREHAKGILGNGFTLLVVFSVVLSSLCYLFMDPLLRLAGASSRTILYAKDYLSIYLSGTIFVQITTGLNSFINAQGRPAIAMFSVVIGATLNIILDPVFIFLFNMQVKGAAIATVISQACSAIWIIHFLTSSQATLPLQRKHLHLKSQYVWPIIGLGLSPFVMASTESLIGFVLNGTLSRFGDIYVSALAIMQSAIMLGGAPLVGFAQGFVPVASYNFGHGNLKRVKQCFQVAVTFMFSFNLILILSMIFFPKAVASSFSDDEQLILIVVQYMPLFLAGMTIFGIQRACQNMFVALGQAKISIFIALLRKVILLVPLAVILPNYWDVKGVYAAEAISDGCAAILCTLLFAYSFPRILRKRAGHKFIK